MTLRNSQTPFDASLVASAESLSVANIDSPTELGSRAGSAGQKVLVYQTVTGTNAWTLYAFDDASSAGANSPYVLAALTSGFWVAVAGKYVNSSVTLASSSTFAVGNASLTTSQLTINQNAGTLPSISGLQGVFARTAAGNNAGFAVVSADDGVAQVVFGDSTSSTQGAIRYANTTDSLAFRTNGSTDRLTIASDGATVLTTSSTGLTIAKTTGTTLVVSSTTASTSTTTGSATFAGGIGVSGAGWFGSTVSVSGSSTGSTFGLSLSNTNAGTSAETRCTVTNDASKTILFSLGSSGNTGTLGGVSRANLAFFVTSTSSTHMMIGTNAASSDLIMETAGTERARLDASSGFTLTHTDDAAGGLILRTSTTDATAKNARIKIQHYTNAEEPVTALLGIAGNGFNQISWGGSSGVENAATVHVFYTAATSTTLTGTERMRIDSAGNVSIGTAALATTATDGFLYIPTCAGAPTGVPTAKTGRSPIIYDTTNNKLYVYNGAWKASAAFT